MRRGRNAALACALGALLTGCGLFYEPPGSEIEDAISDILSPQEEAGNAIVELSEVADGDWTKVLIVCRGASTDDVESTLGFGWPDGPDPQNAAFLSAIVFADDASVTSHYQAGLEDDWYITFCPNRDALEEERLNEAVICLPRASAEVTFQHSRGGTVESSYWYVPSGELNPLAISGC